MNVSARQHLPHFVYRLFACGGELLYVGCSIDPDARLGKLRYSERWVHLVARRSLERYESLALARAAEREAIKTEGPLFNVNGRRGLPTRHYHQPHKTSLDMRDGTTLRIWYVAWGGWLIGDEAIARWEAEMEARRRWQEAQGRALQRRFYPQISAVYGDIGA